MKRCSQKRYNEYKNFEYSDEIKRILSTVHLTEEEENKIRYWEDNINKSFIGAIREIFKMYKLDFSPSDIAEIYGLSARGTQYFFKELGLQRDRFEAQQIAVKKRDYSEIRKTYKRTMLERLTTNQLSGTMIEQYIRHEVDLMLGSRLNDCEIIIGVNSMNIIGVETDIPIIIIKGKYLFKFIIEVDGVLFHDNPKQKKLDIIKSQTAINKGYTIFRLSTKGYYSSEDNPELRYKREIKTKVEGIVESIVKEVNGEPKTELG